MAPGGQLGQRGHEHGDDLRGTPGEGGRRAGLGDLEQHGLQGLEEPVDLLHGAPPVPRHGQVLADGPHLGRDRPQPPAGRPPRERGCWQGGRPYHGGEHGPSALDPAHAPHELQQLLRQLHHQRRVQRAQGQEPRAQHPARGGPRWAVAAPRPQAAAPHPEPQPADKTEGSEHQVGVQIVLAPKGTRSPSTPGEEAGAGERPGHRPVCIGPSEWRTGSPEGSMERDLGQHGDHRPGARGGHRDGALAW